MIGQQIDVVAGDSMEQHGGAAKGMTSVLSTKPSLNAPCLRHRALHHCGDLDQFRTTGQTSVDFKNHQVPIDFGWCACTVHSPSHEKLSAGDQLINFAIKRHGFIWILWTGAIPNHMTKNLTDEFYSTSVLRRTITASKKGASAIS